ncbi:MAG: ZIP family metal transporter [Anaerolineales bacterium]|nr:ZIP family metal transporter [Anaerolineales bacterium]
MQRLSIWISALIPLVALVLMLALFVGGDPLALFTSSVPPIEDLSFEQIRVLPEGFEVSVINGGPEPITIAQVLVDEAYWEFTIQPSAVLGRLATAEISIPYPWVEGEPHEIRLVTNTGATFDGEVEIAVPTPQPGSREIMAYGLVGIYVGIIPVGLGLLWYPAMRRLDRKWIGSILALTVGLLVFLLIDTSLEALEFAAELPNAFQGITVAFFAALLTWFLLIAIRSNSKIGTAVEGKRRVLYIATLIALGIGLHNLGEGLAIGTSFALGEVALGSFLVVGFTLHNITEGVGIAAPLLPRLSHQGGSESEKDTPASPKLGTFLALTLLAGAPAILGIWIGGFVFSPLLTVLFLGIGVGAIWQVIVEVADLLKSYANAESSQIASWPNMIGFALGFLIMYLTAFLVSV